MARVIALVHTAQWPNYPEALRVFVVCACALALIAADKALPF
jgi:hypothetical protein